MIRCAKRATEPQVEMQCKLGSWSVLQIPLRILLRQPGSSYASCSVMLEQPNPLQYWISFLFVLHLIDAVTTQQKVARGLQKRWCDSGCGLGTPLASTVLLKEEAREKWRKFYGSINQSTARLKSPCFVRNELAVFQDDPRPAANNITFLSSTAELDLMQLCYSKWSVEN